MSQFGQVQPQPEPHQHQAKPGALIAGPDGVVYTVTRAGAAPAADATMPARPHFGYAPDRPPGIPGEIGPCFSY